MRCGLGVSIVIGLVVTWSGAAVAQPQAAWPDSARSQARARAEMRKLARWVVSETGKSIQVAKNGCWKQTTAKRGVGTVPTTCQSNEERNGALCYPRCKPGYTGAGPVCWQTCPAGFRNDGAHCGKPRAYGRGAGYPWKLGDRIGSLDGARARCRRANRQGCEKHGQIIYPRCRAGYRPMGCCVCSPRCPPTMTDIGVSCRKHSYGRTAGRPLRCRSGLEMDAGLCYRPCGYGYVGRGPVCWARCPTGTTNCGAFCARDTKQCMQDAVRMGVRTAELFMNLIGAASGGTAIAARAGVRQAATQLVNVAQAATTTARAAALRAARPVLMRILMQGGRRAAGEVRRATQAVLSKQLGARLARETATAMGENIAWNLVLPEMSQDAATRLHRSVQMLADWDLTGIAGVMAAFIKPMCGVRTPMPRVNRDLIQAAVSHKLDAASRLVRAMSNAPLLDTRGPVGVWRTNPRRREIVCHSNQTLSVDRLSVVTGGTAIVARDNCVLMIRDSYIRGGATAIRVLGRASVTVINSEVEGGHTALSVAQQGRLRAIGSTFKGPFRRQDRGRLVDVGGNMYRN